PAQKSRQIQSFEPLQSLPAHQAGSPAEPTAERFHQDEMPRLDPSVVNGRLQGERDRRGRSVGMLFDRHYDVVQGQPEFSPHSINDSAVGLVWNQPIDVRRSKSIGV